MEQKTMSLRNGERRRLRPMSRTRELVVLTVLFAIGAALQAAYLLSITSGAP